MEWAFATERQIPFVKSPNHGGALKPRFIVIHDTASGLKDDGDIAWLTNPAAKVSAHVVVSRQGKITQLVPFNVVAWHAGQSQWKGLKFMNSYAVGIEIDNPGKLQKVSDGVYKNEICTIDTNKDPSLKVEYAKTNAHGAGYWLHYSPEQIAAVTDLCAALAETFKIEDIITHWMISPGRKIDTNPLYPLDQLKASALPYHPVGLLSTPEDGERHDTDEAGEEQVDLDPHSDVRDESGDRARQAEGVHQEQAHGRVRPVRRPVHHVLPGRASGLEGHRRPGHLHPDRSGPLDLVGEGMIKQWFMDAFASTAISDFLWAAATSEIALSALGLLIVVAGIVGYLPIVSTLLGGYAKTAKLVFIIALAALVFLLGFRTADNRAEAKILRDQIAARDGVIARQEVEPQSWRSKRPRRRASSGTKRRSAPRKHRTKSMTMNRRLKARPNAACLLTPDDFADRVQNHGKR